MLLTRWTFDDDANRILRGGSNVLGHRFISLLQFRSFKALLKQLFGHGPVVLSMDVDEKFVYVIVIIVGGNGNAPDLDFCWATIFKKGLQVRVNV